MYSYQQVFEFIEKLNISLMFLNASSYIISFRVKKSCNSEVSTSNLSEMAVCKVKKTCKL